MDQETENIQKIGIKAVETGEEKIMYKILHGKCNFVNKLCHFDVPL